MDLKKGYRMKRTPNELLTFMLDSITRIASLHDTHALLLELSTMCRDIVFADRCSIWILDTRTDTLWTKVADGVQPIKVGANVGLVGTAVSKNETLIINDVQNDSRFNNEIDKTTGYMTKTMMVIPMENKSDEVIGAIQVINKKDDDIFSDLDLKYLNLAASYAAESIGTILLLEEIEKTQKELIYIMGATGESRSKETGNHVKRVAEYSWLLAKLYGLSEKECEMIRDVSPMHDIGKIAIRDAILNKPGRLTDDEMEIMKTHANLGYEILQYSELPLLKAASIVAYEHHEKYDGSGYPKQLKGDNIHIFGRITALADVFDALGSDRVYKKAWEDERIFKLFREERGKHFDPRLVDLFLENREDFFHIRDRFVDV
jgi:response regulator RpfG family c-di-GMP phosphodiesterase